MLWTVLGESVDSPAVSGRPSVVPFFHRKQVPIVFAGCTVFLCLTVYNPLFVKYLVPTLGFENEYYRFLDPSGDSHARLLWGTPGGFCKKRWYKAAFCLLLTGMLILAGNPAPGAAGGFALPQNLYKVPNDLRAVCSVIHQDGYGKPESGV